MTQERTNDKDTRDANRDPLTDAPGAHQVGAGVGAAVGTVIGAAAGALGGPATMAAGAALGAAVAGGVIGGLAGKAAGEKIDPTVETEYWSKNFRTRPYVKQRDEFGLFEPAFRYGWESYEVHRGRQFDDVEPDLRRGWDDTKSESGLTWDEAQAASRDAWHRVERSGSGEPAVAGR